MKKICAVVAAVLVVALANASVLAQQQKAPKGKAPAGPQTRYFDLSSTVFNELGAEAILRENRQGATVVSAELDVCHWASSVPNRLDRFVVPLKVEGNRLVGSAQSLEGKQAVSVSLTRRAAGGNVTFEGSVTSGDTTVKVRSPDNAEMTEEEIVDQFLNEGTVESAPTDFSATWPQVLYARVGRSQLPALLEALRDQNVRVVFNTVQASCRLLRTGRYTVQIDVEAERAAAVLAKLKSVAGVTEVGFSPNPPNMQRAILFPSAGWRDATGRLERDKLAATIGKAMASTLSATLAATTFDPLMGELSVELKRPDDTIGGLKLTQQVTVSIVIAPESLTANQQSILWIESVSSKFIDERPAPRLTFTFTQSEEEGQSTEPEGSENLAAAVAAVLKGKLWNAETEQWQQ